MNRSKRLLIIGISCFVILVIAFFTWILWINSDYDLEKSYNFVSEKAVKQAIKLSGKDAIECGESIFPNFKLGHYLFINECVMHAFQNKQAFLFHLAWALPDYTESCWIVGAPEGDVYLVRDSYDFLGAVGPSVSQCHNPLISTKGEKKILECEE